MANREPEGMRSAKLVIAVGGGPTAVINQSLVVAVLEARLFPPIERIYGARYGVRPLVTTDCLARCRSFTSHAAGTEVDAMYLRERARAPLLRVGRIAGR